jgi:hypothetical protein
MNTEGFFLQSKKDGVEQFEILDVIVDHIVELKSLEGA